MDQIPNINIPVDALNSVIAQQNKLRQDINENNKERDELKNYVANLVSAAVVTNAEKTSKFSSSNSIGSSVDTFKTIKSVESIQDIPESNQDDPTIPSIEDFVAMSAEGKLNITDELLKELYTANSRIDAVNEVSTKLQKRWCEIDSTIEAIKRDIKNIINAINNIKQYFKVDNLLLHRFLLPYTKNLSSFEFSNYVANQINNLIPNLPIRVSVHHISTAHPLPTKSKKSNVVVVRFANRYIKDMIYKYRHLVGHGVSITEHLTDYSISIVKKAEELFGRHNVHTENCKIFVNCNGRFNLVNSVDEAHKLYVKFCEHIGNNNLSLIEPSTHNYHHSYNHNYYHRFPLYSDSVKNSYSYAPNNTPNLNAVNSTRVTQRRQSQRGRNTYRGKPSTGYSVRNRVY